jgi:uncharacterized peroxidase-related enzyme
MSFISTTPPQAARGDVAAMYRLQQAAWGHVPNYAKVFSHRPEVLARWGRLLAEIKRPLDTRRFELLTFVAAHELGHTACALAHGQALRAFFSDDEIVAIAQGRLDGLLDAPEQALMRFARLVAADASGVTAADVAGLRELGWTDADIFDAAATAAGRAFFTKLLDALGVRADASFQALDPSLRLALTIGRPIDDAACERLPEPATDTAADGSVSGGHDGR